MATLIDGNSVCEYYKNNSISGVYGCFVKYNANANLFNDILINKDTNFIYNNNATINTITIENKELIIQEFINGKIGFKVFKTQNWIDDFELELKNLNNLTQIAPKCIEKYTALYGINCDSKQNNKKIKNTVYGFVITNDANTYNIGVIMYKICDGDLFTAINQQPIFNFDFNKFKENIEPLLSTLHNANYAHTDIKLENILNCSSDYKLIDFSLVNLSNIKEYTSINTIKYIDNSEIKYNITLEYLLPYFYSIPIKDKNDAITEINKTFTTGLLQYYNTPLIKSIFSKLVANPNTNSLINLLTNPQQKDQNLDIIVKNFNLHLLKSKYINYYFIDYKSIDTNPYYLSLLNVPFDYTPSNNDLGYFLKKSDEFAIALCLYKIIKYRRISDKNIVDYIDRLLKPELYFQTLPVCNSNNSIKKTGGKIHIAGRERILYQGTHRKQYVKMKGGFVAVSTLKKEKK